MLENPPFSWVVLQSRRGQKELDILLERFNSTYYHQLSLEEQRTYHDLLQSRDHQLWDWFFHLQPSPAEFAQLVRQIAPINTSTSEITDYL